MNKIIQLSVILLLALCGCKSVNTTTQQRVISAAKVAAYVGTSEFLKQDSAGRQGFINAENQLNIIAAQDHVDMASLLAIVNQLPIKELKSDNARITITAATILLSDYAGALPVDKLDNLKPVAKAIADGIALAIGQ